MNGHRLVVMSDEWGNQSVGDYAMSLKVLAEVGRLPNTGLLAITADNKFYDTRKR